VNQLNVSLWGDEAWAATLINKTPLNIIKFVSHDTSPPFYYLFTHFWTRIFGMSEIGLRTSSLFFWFLTAVFTALIAHQLWKNKKTTFLAFLLVLLNPFLFQYAFEARMYAILALMSTMATYFFVAKKWPAYVISATVSLYCHHFSLFIIFIHFLWTILEFIKKPQKQNFWKKIKPFVFIGFLYLPWIPAMYKQTKMVTDKGFWLGKPVPKDLIELILKFIKGLNKHVYQKYLVIIAVFILLLRKWKLKDSKTNFLLLSLFLPIFIVYIISHVAQSIFYDRYMINLIPVFVLILVSNRRKTFSFPFFLVFIFFLLRLNFWFFTNPDKRPFKQLASYVKQTRQQGDTLINWSGKAHHLFESKYYGVYAPIYTPDGPLPFYTGTALMESFDQIEELPDSERIGVMTSEPIETINLESYIKTDRQQFGSLSFSWWERKK